MLDTISKILSSCVARELTYNSEKFSTLAQHQYGGHPGRNTTDALHLLTTFVKDSWRRGKVTVGLFLDIKSAFPSVNHKTLVYDMHIRGIPQEYTNWIKAKLLECTTHIHFNDQASDSLPLRTGIDQGCPLLPLSYTYYNADLVDSNATKHTLKIAYHDDTVFLARGKSFEEAL